MLFADKKIFLALILGFTLTLGFSQSPWVHKKNDGYTHLSIGTIPNYSTVFKGNFSNLEQLPYTISEYSLQSYTEFGLGKGLEVLIDLPVRFVTLESREPSVASGSVFGLGGPSVGLKYSLLNSGLAVSGITSVSLPLLGRNEASAIRTSYDATGISQVFSAGKGLKNSYFYFYGGFGWYSSISSDVRFGGEFGRKFKEKFWVMLNLGARQSIMNKSGVDPVYSKTFSYVTDQSNVSLAIKMSYDLTEKLGLNFSTNLISFQAENLPFQRPISLGAFMKW